MASQRENLDDNVNVEKLSSLCLSCIVQNFESFMVAYKTGNSIPHKYFEFLQRSYSTNLLEELSISGEFENYIEFILNPYLKEVNLKNSCDNVTEIINRLKEIGPTITSLTLALSNYSSDSLEQLASFLPNLESLTLSNINITEDVFRSIGSNCHALKILKLLQCDVSDECIEALCFARNDNTSGSTNNNVLQHLDINNAHVTVQGIICALKNLKNLSFLHHNNLFDAIYNLHFDDMQNNAFCDLEKYKLENLTIFNVNSYPIKFVDACISLFPKLKNLTASGIESQIQIDTLLKFPLLTEVSFSFVNQSLDLVPFLELRGKNLEIFHIGYVKVSVDSLVKFCPKIKKLELVYCDFILTENSTTVFNHSLQCLNNLSLQGFKVDDAINLKSVKLILSSSPNLETLYLYYSNGLTDEFVKSILSYNYMKTLKELFLDCTDITMSSVKDFVLKTPNLKLISLHDNNFTDDEIAELQLLRPHLDIQCNDDGSNFSDPNGEDFRDYDYFDYESDASYDYYDYGDDLYDDDPYDDFFG